MAAISDLFFSYRRKDLERAQPLLAALATTGLKVWRDETSLPDAAPITTEIHGAIAGSKALIAFYSAAYPVSHACMEELTAAWIAAQQAGELPYSRVLVINPEPALDHVPSVLREQQSMGWPPDPSGFAALAGRIREQLDRLTGTIPHSKVQARPDYHGMAAASASRFVGRVREMWDLHGLLTANRISIVTGVSGQATAQVRGMGGNGKSMLAREYAIRFGAAYPGGVFWLNAFGNDDSKGFLDSHTREALRHDQIRNFAVSRDVPLEGRKPEEIETAFWRQLRQANLPCLWIVDDLPSGMEVAEFETKWIAPWTGASTLVTTRSADYGSLGGFIDLEMLNREESVLLLTSRRAPSSTAEWDAAKGIAGELGGHPLAVEVAGSYLAKGFETYAGYRKSLDDPNADALEFGAKLKESLPTGHERSIAGTLLKSVRMLGQDGLTFLELASSLAVAPIPLQFVTAVFERLPEPRPNAVQGIDEADSLGLAKNEGADARIVHALVSRAIRRAGYPGEATRLAALRMLAQILPPVAADVRRRDEIGRELAHARHLVSNGLHNLETVAVAVWVARHDYELGNYAQARWLQEQAIDANSRLLGPENPETLKAMNNFAMTAKQQGDLHGAREVETRVLNAVWRLMGPEDEITLTMMNNLAQTENLQGDLTGALQLLEHVWEVRLQCLGPEHPNTLMAMSNLAQTHYELGNFAGAGQLQEDVLGARQRVLGPAHPDTLTAMQNLASTLKARDHDLTRARELQDRVASALVRLLGPEHPSTLTALGNVAAMMHEQSDLAGAREVQDRVLEASRRTLGNGHRGTLTAMGNLASTLIDQGDLPGGRKLQEEALETYRSRMGPAHPHTSLAAWNLYVTLSTLGDPARTALMTEFLEPLLHKDPGSLSRQQRPICESVREILETPPPAHDYG